MLITSQPFPVLFLLCLFALTNQQCPAYTNVPSFHSASVALESMRQQKPSMLGFIPNLPLFYVFNYPTQVIGKGVDNNVEGLVSVMGMEVQGIERSINYKVTQNKNTMSLMIIIQPTPLRWKSLLLSVLLYNKQSHPNILVIQNQIPNAQSRITLSIQTKIPTQSQPKFKLTQTTKSLAFIHGINVERREDLDFMYKVDVTSSVDVATGNVGLGVAVGAKCELKEIWVSTLVFNEDLERGVEIYGAYVGFQEVGNGKVSEIFLGSNFHSYDYFIMGLSTLELKQGPGMLSLSFSFKPKSQNILTLTSLSIIKSIKLAVFRVGRRVEDICSNCSFQNKIQLSYPKTVCISQCRNGAVLGKDQATNAQKCVYCPAQLNYTVGNNNVCQCKSGLVVWKGRCVEQSATFSTANSDCIQPNTVRRPSGRCECKPGYERRMVFNTNLCQSICGNGYYNGRQCVFCPQGSFANDFLSCQICTANCATCQSQFTCTICASGFQRNQVGQCIEICGDGIVFNQECDDGNTFNGDGCSSTCKIQDYYICSLQRQASRPISRCQIALFQVVVKQTKYQSGNLILGFQLNPPLTKRLSTQQVKQILKINYIKGSPRASYYSQDSKNLGLLRHVGAYASLFPPPGSGPQIQAQILIPNNPAFVQRITEAEINKAIRQNRNVRDRI